VRFYSSSEAVAESRSYNKVGSRLALRIARSNNIILILLAKSAESRSHNRYNIFSTNSNNKSYNKKIMSEKISTKKVEQAGIKKEVSEDGLEDLKKVIEGKEFLINSPDVSEEIRKLLSGFSPESLKGGYKKELEAKKRKKESVSVESQTVRIGDTVFPVWQRESKRLRWTLEGEQFREGGKTMIEIKFRRSDGVEIVPGGVYKGRVRLAEKDRYMTFKEFKEIREFLSLHHEADTKTREIFKSKYPKTDTDTDTDTEWVFRTFIKLNNLATGDDQEALEADPNFVLTPYVTKVMEKFARLANQQLEAKRGILILEGDAGTGKNKIVEHFASLTNRPVFRFTCSAGKDEQDFKYLLEYDAKKGTYRIKSTVIKALETPGAILIFDEINTLKPEVAKMLNSLFDDDRAIYLGEGEEKTKAAEGVILVGLQNPQHYMGVKPTAETIKDRAMVMEVGYPPFLKEKKSPGEKDQYLDDEALILRQYAPVLKRFSRGEFRLLWDFYINDTSESIGVVEFLKKEELTPVEKAVKDVFGIILIANKIREAYSLFHDGKSDHPVNFIFSLRGGVQAVLELPHIKLTEAEVKIGQSLAKKAVEEVVLPKVPRGEERINIKALIKESDEKPKEKSTSGQG